MPLADMLKFDDKGLIPAIIFDAGTNEPLVLCHLDREALARTLETGFVHVFRRSKGRVMLKGETSGHTQRVVDILVNCESTSLAIKVEQKVAACHAGYYTCYYRRYNKEADELEIQGERVFDPKKAYE
jgi:phosphoribosyl-AMP cyclohydrolase